MQQQIINLCKQFCINGTLKSFKYFSSGHINTTVLVEFEENEKTKQYVLQKINKNVFKKPEDVMYNISNITHYIKQKLENSGQSADRKVLRFLKSTNNILRR